MTAKDLRDALPRFDEFLDRLIDGIQQGFLRLAHPEAVIARCEGLAREFEFGPRFRIVQRDGQIQQHRLDPLVAKIAKRLHVSRINLQVGAAHLFQNAFVCPHRRSNLQSGFCPLE